ncbi:MAG: cellobiose phosphorylase [Lachnospiraceae bacterium]|nr:cellobiose phosphorylase [Lachnospiraceae bacterium]
MKKINRFLSISQGDCRYTFLPAGDIFTFIHENFLINQFRGNAKDGSVNNIYLRIHHESGIRHYPLLGIKSGSLISYNESMIQYKGCVEDISYIVTFRPVSECWFWDVSLDGCGKTVDLVYGQDIGIAPENSVYTNELYVSQYLDHSIYRSENGYIICSRQNMPSGGQFPYLQQGVIGAKAAHYSTDGLQFFGLSSKETGIPAALSQNLEDVNLQYEFAYAALQTETFSLNGTKTVSFYGYFLKDHPAAVSTVEYQEEILAAYHTPLKVSTPLQEVPPVAVKSLFGSPFSSPSFTKGELDCLFPDRILEEQKEGTLLSFFTEDHAHVVTKEKELLMERPHGTIIITPPDENKINSSLISSSQYMYGIFNSHVVTGNTDLHKFLSTPRGFLNLLKNSGQRIYIKIDNIYRLLNLPGLFEMGMNYSRWYYKIADDMVCVTAYTLAHASDLVLELNSAHHIAYDFIVTNQLVMGSNEYTSDISCEPIADGLRFILSSDVYPGLHYDMLLPDCDFSVSDDRIFFEEEEPFDETFLTLAIPARDAFSMIIRAHLTEEEEKTQEVYSFEREKQACLNYYSGLINHFQLTSAPDFKQAHILNETIWWYTHNAMIHFSMPHGLEQPGGAAWGTRDICQGPIEFFLTTQHYDLVRAILLNIFSHQDEHTREWPQWFMFDRYSINPGECHGDVIFWPLKCVADYLEAAGDVSVLDEMIPYDGGQEKSTLLSHIGSALSNIKETRMIGETGLITYAGGDWDDTLQPASDDLKQRLVSAWTVALAYQTFRALNKTLLAASHKLTGSPTESHAARLADEFGILSEKVKDAFENILIKDGIIAGFLDFGDTYTYMLHPDDETTGIHYRLLPMTRSIIAELADPAQADRNAKLIHEHLKCPDGVRLMDKPAGYDGGVSRLFKRAEQAANVGREISLQYTHAHIRYIEAMAKLGNADEAWNCLFTINPILIQDSVPNANIRQSNLYFSSSDGAYHDRYDYAARFHLLKTGEIGVKGGWRLYSSGPGIYIRQLIQNILGIRFIKEGLLIDPVLPAKADGLVFTYDCFGRSYTFRYHINTGRTSGQPVEVVSNGAKLDGLSLSNPYRTGGVLLTKEMLETCSNTLDIYLN